MMRLSVEKTFREVSLEQTIERICVQMKNQDWNEAQVSQGTVLRMLDALGWPIFNPSIVFPEYLIGGGEVDFALCKEENPLIYIEVKNNGITLGIKEEKQLFKYAFQKSVPLGVLTNGHTWKFYYPPEGGYPGDRCFCDLNIYDDLEKCGSILNRYLSYKVVSDEKAFTTMIKKDYHSRYQQLIFSMIDQHEEKLLKALEALVNESKTENKPSRNQVRSFLKAVSNDAQLNKILAVKMGEMYDYQPSREQVKNALSKNDQFNERLAVKLAEMLAMKLGKAFSNNDQFNKMSAVKLAEMLAVKLGKAFSNNDQFNKMSAARVIKAFSNNDQLNKMLAVKVEEKVEEMLAMKLAEKVEKMYHGYQPSRDQVQSFLNPRSAASRPTRPPQEATLSSSLSPSSAASRPTRPPQEAALSSPLSPSADELFGDGFGFVLYGKLYPARKASAILVGVFNELAKFNPLLLTQLTESDFNHYKGRHKGRRRCLARNKKLLLNPERTQQLESGWYIDTTFSREATISAIKLACRIASVEYGKDLILYLPPKQTRERQRS